MNVKLACDMMELHLMQINIYISTRNTKIEWFFEIGPKFPFTV